MRRSLVNILIRLVSFRVNFLSFKDLKRFRLKPLFLAFSIAVIAASSFISTGIAAFLPATSVSAASPPTAIKGVCQNNFSFTQYSSPFQSTKGLCLGDDSQDHVKFFQFAIELPGAISGIKITGKDGSVSAGGSGGTIAFTKESATRYVSTDGVHQGLGYQASIGGTTTVCNKTSGSSTITFTISGGVNNPKPITSTINICDYWNKDYVIDQTPTGLKADNIAQVGSTGQILGNFCSIRNSNILPTSQQTGLLDQLGIMTITLNAINSNNSNSGHGIVNGSKDTWYTLTNGKLTIQNLKPDIYDLSFNYNDQLVLLQQDSIASADMTTNSLKISFSNVRVTAGADTWVTNPDGKTPTCYNNNGTVGNPNAPITTPSSCVVDGIGWMVCPIMNALGGLNDALYGWIQSVLVLNPLTQNDTSGAPTAQYQNWSIIRNIANVLLIIAFLLIIFSQISSIGISNYGVKKMLPRVILIAVAINLSWTIMSFAVDAVNIIGVGLHDLLNSAAVNANSQTIDGGNAFGSLTTGLVAGTAGLAVGGVVALTIAGGSTLVLIALPFIVGAALALLAAVITLFVRNALIIVLVIIAPVALVAYLLPNTEEYFKKWRKMLTSMLFLFPVAALLFAGAKFAAYVIVTSNQPLAQLTAIFVMAAPLGLLPWLARSSGGILASVNKQLGSMAKGVQNATQKGLAARVQTGKDERRANMRNWLGGKRDPSKLRGEGTGQTYDKDGAHYERGADGKLHQTLHKAGDLSVDKEGVPLGKKRARRTISGVFSDMNKGLETRSETAKKAAGSNFQERGLGAGPGAAKVAGIVDAGKTEELRGKAIGATYEARLAARGLDSGSRESVFQSNLADAEKTTAAFSGRQKQIQTDRIKNNAVNTVAGSVGASGIELDSGATLSISHLEGVSQAEFSASEGTKASELQIQRSDKESGVASRSIQLQKDAEAGIKVYDTKQDEVFKGRQANEKPLMELAEQQDSADRNIKRLDTEAEDRLQKLADGKIDNDTAGRERTPEEIEALKQRANRIHEYELAQRRAKLSVDNAHSKHDTDFEGTKLVGGDNFDLAAEAMAGKAESDRIKQKQAQTESEVRAGLGPDENPELAAFSEEQRNAIVEADRSTKSSLDATAYAEGTSKVGLANLIDKGRQAQDDIASGKRSADSLTDDEKRGVRAGIEASGASVSKNDEGTILKNSDGSPIIDTALTEAKSARIVREDREGDVKTYVAQANNQGLGSSGALTELGYTRNGKRILDASGKHAVRDQTRAQREGHLRYVLQTGDVKGVMAALNMVADTKHDADTLEEQASAIEADPSKSLEEKRAARNKADNKAEEAKFLQTAIVEEHASLPPWVGGTDLEEYNKGTQKYSNEELAMNAVTGGKLSPDKWRAMNIDHMEAFEALVGDPNRVNEELDRTAEAFTTVLDGEDPAKRAIRVARKREEQKQNFANALISLDTAQYDRKGNGKFEDRHILKLDKIRSDMQALGLPSPQVPTGETVPDPRDPSKTIPEMIEYKRPPLNDPQYL